MSVTTPVAATVPVAAPAPCVVLGPWEVLAPTGPAHASGPRAAVLGAGPVEDWLDLRGELGRGHRHLPVAAQLVLGVGRRALAALGADALAQVPPERRELLVATACGASGTHTAMDATILSEGSTMLSPLAAPHFSVNLLGARLSAELVAHGAATTYTTPTTAVVDALAAASLRLARGVCDLAVVVAVEHAAPGAPVHATETGALALVLARGAAGARGPGLRVVRRTWHENRLPAAVDSLVQDMAPVRGVDEVLLVADPRTRDELAGALPAFDGARVRVRTCGDGTYRPAAAVLDTVTRVRSGVHVVVVVGAHGRLAGVRVDGGAASVPTRDDEGVR